MTNNKQDKKTSNIIKVCILIAIFAGVAALMVLLLNGNTKYTSDGDEVTATEYLYCSASDPKNPYFESSKASNAVHEIKYTFKNGATDRISYTYTGEFDSENSAKAELSKMTFKYNDYMGTTQLYQQDLNPTWTVLDNKAIINLFMTNGATLTSETMRFVFLGYEQLRSLASASAESLKGYYESLNFTCKIGN